MEWIPAKPARAFAVVGAVMGVFALFFQLVLIIKNSNTSLVSTVIRYFSFYTILTNILVTACFIYLLAGPSSRAGKFFAKTEAITAIAVYITIVGLTYNIILRQLWEPRGLQLVVDELLHSVIPVYFVLFWILFVPKSAVRWKSIPAWLVFPAVYLIYILIRGSINNHYPYDFVDVGKFGYPQVLLNSLIMTVAFLVVSALFVSVARSKKEKK